MKFTPLQETVLEALFQVSSYLVLWKSLHSYCIILSSAHFQPTFIMAERWSDDVDPLSRAQKRIPLGVSAGQSD